MKIDSKNNLLVLGILITPLILLSTHIFPNSDDFAFYNIRTNYGFWEAQKYWYSNWTGRYASSAVMSLKLFLGSENYILYRLAPIILIFLSIHSIYLLVSLFYPLKTRIALINESILYFLLFCFLMPSIYEGFYWLSGSITYTLSNILLVYNIFFAIRFSKTKKNKYLFFSILMLIITCGLNETILVINLFFIILTNVFFNIPKRQSRRINKRLLFLMMIIVILCFLIVLLAPGNEIRQNGLMNHGNLIYALKKTIIAVKGFLGIWIPAILIVALFVLSNDKSNRSKDNFKIKTIEVVFLLVISLSIPFIGFFASYWSMGLIPPNRAINTILWCFLLLSLLSILTLAQIYFGHEIKNLSKNKFLKYSLFLILIIQLQKENNIRSSFIDLLSGNSISLFKELSHRIDHVKSSNQDTIYLMPLNTKTILIKGLDISSNPRHWRNILMAEYFDKNVIILKKNGFN